MQHEICSAASTCANIATFIDFALNQLKSNFYEYAWEVEAALRRFCRLYDHFSVFPTSLTYH